MGAWEELERRRVPRVAAAYVVAAFAVVQAAELWLPGLGAPNWTLRLVLGAAVLGFPAAIVLAAGAIGALLWTMGR